MGATVFSRLGENNHLFLLTAQFQKKNLSSS